MKILAIETSCDETAISLVEAGGGRRRPKFKVLAHRVASQTKIHAHWGGVVPMLAKREHAKNLPILLNRILKPGDYSLKPDLIAVTQGPGLEPALWTGINFAEALAKKWARPLVAVNHLEGHIVSPLVKNPPSVKFPALALLVSGGHTLLALVAAWGRYRLIGQTRDDAAGEAFDKVGRLLGLPYPGGPAIAALANKAKSNLKPKTYSLPRPMLHSGDLDFSFSGLKTAVRYLGEKTPPLTLRAKAALAREFQQAVIDVLLAKTLRAIRRHRPKTLIAAGGVIANVELKRQLAAALRRYAPEVQLLLPPHRLATDNATMIAVAAYLAAGQKKFRRRIGARGNLML